MNGLTVNNQSTELQSAPTPRYLLNKKNGRVFMWQPIIAVDKNFSDCDIDGNPVGSPQGDDPFLQVEIKRVADQVGSGAAQSYGEELTRRAAEKFKAIGGGPVDYVRLESDKRELYKNDSYAWVYERIDKNVRDALSEIQVMTLKALHKINGSDVPYIRNPSEVSIQWQIDNVKAAIYAG